jgi:hypothetical protein
LEYPDFTVIVVDNASTDDSVEFVRHRFPQVNIQCHQYNLGFAAGNNTALHHLETDFAALVNPDVVVSSDWLRHLIAAMLEDKKIGIAGCKIYFPGENRLQHAGGSISYPRAMPGHYGLNEEDVGRHETMRDVDYVTGAAMVLRSAMLDEIGLFDEGYFLYFEEVDLCARVRRAGYRVTYIPEAKVTHEESVLTGKGSAFYLQHMQSSRWRFLLKQYDLAGVLRDTIPAEKESLARLNPFESRAAAIAYRETVKALPDIWTAREADGGSQIMPVSEEQGRNIAEGLRSLHRIALSGTTSSPPIYLDNLGKKWRIRERPFTSDFPLIGPLISRFREFWNNVATKWYVRHLLQQQNEFNMLILQQLQVHSKQLEQQSKFLLEQDESQFDQDLQIAQLKEQAAHLRRSLDSLEKHLNRLEEGDR